MSRLTSSLMIAVLSLTAAAGSMFAQSSTGTIVGTVTDASGAVVPAAALTITNKANSAARNVVADDAGTYSAPALAAGDLSYVWMYVVGPLAGGAAAALLYDKYFLPAEQKPPVEAAESHGKRRR